MDKRLIFLLEREISYKFTIEVIPTNTIEIQGK